MDENQPLLTFKPIGEDKPAKPGPSTTPAQPQDAEQPLGPHAGCARVPPGSSWPSPPGWSPPELVALRAQTRLWFEQTQAWRLSPEGEPPVWFHGFISRREAEQLLEDQPLGCFLVRFSESTVGFVLSYRGRDRCRHFVLDQLPDGRYVILGERSAHSELAELLHHHTTAPVVPYQEFLTAPVPRRGEGEPRGGMPSPAGSSAACSPLSEPPAKLLEYPPVSPEPPGDRAAAPARSQPAEPNAGEAPGAPPALPAKSSSRAGAQGSHSPSDSPAAPEGAYAQVHKAAAAPPAPPEAKYQQLLRFHIYAEPREGIAPGPPGCCQPEEPIPFYAMARGSGPDENIYSEVAPARQDRPPPLPRAPQGGSSTLPPKPRPHRRLFRSVSSQDCRRRQLPAAPTADGRDRGAPGAGTEGTLGSLLELDDPTYSWSTPRAQPGAATDENVYEQLPGDQP